MSGRLGSMLEGVHPGWKGLIRGDPTIKTALRTVVQELLAAQQLGHTIVPDVGHIFEAFRYFGPDDVSVVIVAQDPYYTVVTLPDGSTAMQAQGLCFSCNPAVGKAQPSLRNICDAVVADLGCAPDQDKTTQTSETVAAMRATLAQKGAEVNLHDLRFWASQGVLLLNRALTTVAGRAKAHTRPWSPFTARLTALLCAHRARSKSPVVFMLWGGDAKNLETSIRQGAAEGGAPYDFHRLLKWSHPSPMADNGRSLANNFMNCGHFRQTNALLKAAALRPIVWLELPTLAACDGSCLDNGGAHPRAGYGAVIAAGPLRGFTLSGAVEPFEYAWADPSDPLHGIRPVNHGDVGELKPVPPSNNRGEYLAACYLLLVICRAGLTKRVEIVSDSNLFIQTMEEWLPKRRRKGTAGQLKNFDLVEIAERLLAIARSRAEVRLTHVRSHQPPPPQGTREYALWKVNGVADELAGGGVGQPARTIARPFWFPA